MDTDEDTAAEHDTTPGTEQAPSFTALGTGALLAGRFEVVDRLSMGGFSLVCRVLDHETGRHVVLKECAPMGLVSRDASGRIVPNNAQAAALMARISGNFRLEAEVLSRLTAAGVEDISSFVAEFEENGTRYIVMEEAHGADLHSWASRFREAGVPFPADALEEILTGLLEILGSVHAQGYFHCDVKPANIVIDGDGNITLIDFGAVRSTGQQHDENVQVSPGFSPPEFYPGHRELIGPWTDIYMLAALFYEIIAGRAPEPANERAVRDRTPRLANDPKLHKIYPSPFLISIDKALSINPADRFASARLWEDAYQLMQAGPQLQRAKAPSRRKNAFASGQISLQAMQRGKAGKGGKAATAAKPGAPLLSSAQIAGKPGAGRPAAAPALRPTTGPARPAAKAAAPAKVAPAPAKVAPAKAVAPAKPAPAPAKPLPARAQAVSPLPVRPASGSEVYLTPYVLIVILLVLGLAGICYASLS